MIIWKLSSRNYNCLLSSENYHLEIIIVYYHLEMPHQKKIRIISLRRRSSEVVETMSRISVVLCCLQEIRWRGASAHMIEGKDSRYKIV